MPCCRLSTFLTGVCASEVLAQFHDDGARWTYTTRLICVWRMAPLSTSPAPEPRSLTTHIRSADIRNDGMLYMDLWRGTMELTPMTGKRRFIRTLPQRDLLVKGSCDQPYRLDLRPLRNRSPASLGVAAMEVIEAACISAESGTNVLVPSLMEQKIWQRLPPRHYLEPTSCVAPFRDCFATLRGATSGNAHPMGETKPRRLRSRWTCQNVSLVRSAHH